MKPIIVVMLAVQVAILLVTGWITLFRRQTADSRRPVWSGLAFALVIVSGTSFQIADKHAAEPGADVLQFGAPLLLGMALMAALITLRQRRGLD
jgi:hypothetical protein